MNVDEVYTKYKDKINHIIGVTDKTGLEVAFANDTDNIIIGEKTSIKRLTTENHDIVVHTHPYPGGGSWLSPEDEFNVRNGNFDTLCSVHKVENKIYMDCLEREPGNKYRYSAASIKNDKINMFEQRYK